MPEEALRAQFAAADDPMQKSFAALMLYYARGDIVDMAPARRVFDVAAMKTVRQHLESAAGVGHAV